MSKNIFKVIGALLVLVLAVSFSVGAVSAADVESHTVSIVNGSIALTQNTPVWPSTDKGPFVSALTDAGVLRQAQIEGDLTYNISFINGTNPTFTVTDINEEIGDGSNWYVFVNDVYTGGVLTPVGLNGNVSILLLDEEPVSSDTYSGLVDAAEAAYKITIAAVTEPVTIGDEDPIEIDIPGFVTGQELLNLTAAAKGLNVVYNEYDYENIHYVWLTNINGITADWINSGYGYALGLTDADGTSTAATEALNRFNVSEGETLCIYLAPSTMAGTSALPVSLNSFGDGYYLDAYIYKLIVKAI